jgi:hypothetical protein
MLLKVGALFLLICSFWHVGIQFENNCEIGVFSKLTNAYCLVAIGGSENFYRLVALCLILGQLMLEREDYLTNRLFH